MEPCSCKFKECGCQDESNAIPSPKCDGSSIPKVTSRQKERNISILYRLNLQNVCN